MLSEWVMYTPHHNLRGKIPRLLGMLRSLSAARAAIRYGISSTSYSAVRDSRRLVHPTMCYSLVSSSHPSFATISAGSSGKKTKNPSLSHSPTVSVNAAAVSSAPVSKIVSVKADDAVQSAGSTPISLKEIPKDASMGDVAEMTAAIAAEEEAPVRNPPVGAPQPSPATPGMRRSLRGKASATETATAAETAASPTPSFFDSPLMTVVGLGGAGGNAVNNMIESNLMGVEFVVANTDRQALELSKCARRVQLGEHTTHGLGAGAASRVGEQAAVESLSALMQQIGDSNMVFLTAGLGGGTGTGSISVVARALRERGILTVAVVSLPFHFEGSRRMRMALEGLQQLEPLVDTMIVIPNQNLLGLVDEHAKYSETLKMADSVLVAGVRGISDLVVTPGLINLDFADVDTIMRGMGKSLMGTGEATGEGRAQKAAETALKNPLLGQVSVAGASGVLVNISGGPDLTLFEVEEAVNTVREAVEDPMANIIFGSTLFPEWKDRVRVSLVITGLDEEHRQQMQQFVPSAAMSPRGENHNHRRHSARQGSGAHPALYGRERFTPPPESAVSENSSRPASMTSTSSASSSSSSSHLALPLSMKQGKVVRSESTSRSRDRRGKDKKDNEGQEEEKDTAGILQWFRQNW